MKRKFPPAISILVAMVLGIIAGYMIFDQFPNKKSAAEIAGYVSIGSDVFLRLIKMLIGPLVFSTLVVGIAHMGDAASVGRVFAKSLGWFITASLVTPIFLTTLRSPAATRRAVLISPPARRCSRRLAACRSFALPAGLPMTSPIRRVADESEAGWIGRGWTRTGPASRWRPIPSTCSS